MDPSDRKSSLSATGALQSGEGLTQAATDGALAQSFFDLRRAELEEIETTQCHVDLQRQAAIPDRQRLARYRRAPELGPSLLFFSGGTALRDTCRELIQYTHNSIHLITPFDSGGSSAKLREAFSMISIGDLRNRVMALIDPKLVGHVEVYRLFDHRLKSPQSVHCPHKLQAELRARLVDMIAGHDAMVAEIPLPMRALVCGYLGIFLKQMPEEFDLRGASVGNLILVGAYLKHDCDIHATLMLFTRLLKVRGTVRPIVDANLHLVASLDDGARLVGQHRITSPQRPAGCITQIEVCRGVDQPEPVAVSIDERSQRLIDEAELICYPIGSFFTSVSACLLPRGVGKAIAKARGCKIYIPNCADDSEAQGTSLEERVRSLLDLLIRDAGPGTSPREVLDFVLIDLERGQYQGGVDIAALKALGVKVLDLSLVSDESAPYLDPRYLAATLMSFV